MLFKFNRYKIESLINFLFLKIQKLIPKVYKTIFFFKNPDLN